MMHPRMDTVMGVYYQHFGNENTALRKKRCAASQLHALLQKHSNLVNTHGDGDAGRFRPHNLMRRMRWIAQILLGERPYINLGRFDKYYRNHIYPDEIENRHSVFYGADIRMIDSILIDQDPSVEAHRRHRGRHILRTD